jgi:hypothetical protein
MIMTIPLLVLIQFILVNYASQKPGIIIVNKKSTEKDDVIEEEQGQRTRKFTVKNSPEIEQCRSDFAKIIKRTSGTDPSAGIASAVEVAHFAYAGKSEVINWCGRSLQIPYSMRYSNTCILLKHRRYADSRRRGLYALG